MATHTRTQARKISEQVAELQSQSGAQPEVQPIRLEDLPMVQRLRLRVKDWEQSTGTTAAQQVNALLEKLRQA